MEPSEQGLPGGEAHSDIIFNCACSSHRLPTDDLLSDSQVLSLSVTAVTRSGDIGLLPFPLALQLQQSEAILA